MKTTALRWKTKAKSVKQHVITAIVETYLAIMTNYAAGIETSLIHAKGAPDFG